MGPRPDPPGVFKHKLKQSFGRFLSPCNDITYLRPIPYTWWDCAHSHARTIGRELWSCRISPPIPIELDAHGACRALGRNDSGTSVFEVPIARNPTASTGKASRRIHWICEDCWRDNSLLIARARKDYTLMNPAVSTTSGRRSTRSLRPQVYLARRFPPSDTGSWRRLSPRPSRERVDDTRLPILS